MGISTSTPIAFAGQQELAAQIEEARSQANNRALSPREHEVAGIRLNRLLEAGREISARLEDIARVERNIAPL